MEDPLRPFPVIESPPADSGLEGRMGAEGTRPSAEQPFVVGELDTPVGPVPKLSPRIDSRDRLGSVKVRWGIGRSHYTVDPGLYALNNPDAESPVLVTANYKMSFDQVRRAMGDTDVWILVLDTKGINVWCASGKGSFGVRELVSRIESSGLKQVVSHRRLILPQLSGPGVAAHLVKRFSGFEVVYGPVRAADIPAFLQNGRKATEAMRRKTFTTWERVVLIPVEIVGASKALVVLLPLLFLAGGVGTCSAYWAGAMNYGLFAVAACLWAVFLGAVLTPLLLPWLPGRAFSAKGFSVGLAGAVVLSILRAGGLGGSPAPWEVWAWILMVPALSSYLAMNFTGASTYTSLSGVKKEMRRFLPLQIGAAAAGLVLWIGSRFLC